MKFLKQLQRIFCFVETLQPKGKTLAVLIGGILLAVVGLFASPTVYYEPDPRSLHQSWQMMVSTLPTANAPPHQRRHHANITDLLSRVDTR